LDLNLLTPLRCIKVLQGPIIFSSNIKIDIRDIYPSLNIIRVRLHFRPLHKRTKLMNYKYPMRPLKQRFTIFILYFIYIYFFRASLSRIFLYFLSSKIYLFKHQRVFTFTKQDIL
jgi:hypothetical protein